MNHPSLHSPGARQPAIVTDGYEYGNTRLRARRSQLLDTADYGELFRAGTPERMLGALRSTAYGPDVELALVQRDPLHRLDTAIRLNLVRSLGDLRRFYTGRPAEGVQLLLGRWDLRNLLAILRSKARPATAPMLDTMLVPAGNLDMTTLSELSQQPSLRSAIELMVAWDVPTRSTARRLLRAWPDYETTGDGIVFEHTLAGAWATTVARTLERWHGTDLEHTLQAEIDQINVLVALRRRDDGPDTGPVELDDEYLAGGTLPHSVLDQARRTSNTPDAAALLTDHRLPTAWDTALHAWAGDNDLSVLAGRLERAIAGAAIALFVAGDPLGIAIPIAFTWAKECEARNVRLVGRAIVHHLEWAEIEQELFP